MMDNNTTTFLPHLDDLIENYNDTPHSSLKNKTPDDMFDNKKLLKEIYEEGEEHNAELSSKIKLKIGNYVRKKVDKGKFEKEKQKYSSEIYLIVEKVGRYYKIQDAEGIIQKRKYKYFELLKVDPKTVEGKLDTSKLKKSDDRAKAKLRLRREGLN